MSQRTPSIHPKIAQPITIGLLALPAFNSMAVNAFIDPFRAANYLRGQVLYHWQFLSLDGGSVRASNGMCLGETVAYETVSAEFDLLVINASWTPENFQDKPLQAWLRKQAKQGTSLVGIDTGAFVLAYAGLMKGYQAVVHYEHLDSFLELFSDVIASVGLYAIDRDRLSCCGGAAAADLAQSSISSRGWRLPMLLPAIFFKSDYAAAVKNNCRTRMSLSDRSCLTCCVKFCY